MDVILAQLNRPLVVAYRIINVRDWNWNNVTNPSLNYFAQDDS